MEPPSFHVFLWQKDDYGRHRNASCLCGKWQNLYCRSTEKARVSAKKSWENHCRMGPLLKQWHVNIRKLGGREKRLKIVERMWKSDKSYEEIASKLKVTRSRIYDLIETIKWRKRRAFRRQTEQFYNYTSTIMKAIRFAKKNKQDILSVIPKSAVISNR